MGVGARGPGESAGQAGSGAPDLSRGKTLAFSALTLAAFFALCESLLAVAGIGSHLADEDPYVGFASNIPLFEETRDASGNAIFATASNKLRFFNAQTFPKAKAPGVRRAFCIGGSTTYGRPYDDSTSFCGWLREFLTAADARARWQVVNAGGISYASYRAAGVMEELAAYEPDIFIIYSGHNEFLEQRTYTHILEMHPALRTLDSALSRTRSYSALRSLIDRARTTASAPERSVLAAEVSTVLDQSIGPDAYERNDELRAQVLEHYRFNLDRMLRIAEEAGADAVLVTPAANLKDCSPFKSEHSADVPEPERARWRERFARGRELIEAERFAEARHEFAAAVAIDERRADAQYGLGQALFALGEYDAARRSFRRAIDEDVCPLRSLPPTRGIVREVAERHDVPLIDFASLLEEAARRDHGHGIPGAEYFLDHVHPTIEGNRRLALALVDVLTEHGLIEPSAAWNSAAVDAVTSEVLGKIDRHRQGIALRNLAKVLSWAGKSEDAAQIARRSLALLGEDAESHFILGAEAAERGLHREAAAHFREAIRFERDYVKAWNNLGISLTRLGRDDEASDAYEEALQIAPEHASARFNLANLLSRLGRTDAAVAHYRELLRSAPDDADAHFNLAKTYTRRGDLALAADHYAEVLAIDPDDADARHNLANLLLELGHEEAAAKLGGVRDVALLPGAGTPSSSAP